MSTLEERFSAALHNTSRSWRQALDRRLKDLGVSQAGWTTIAIIAKAHLPLSQTELAHRLGIENPTLMAMIDRLVKAGFVLRVPSETDRRIKRIVLTQAGREVYSQVKVQADAFRAELLADVDAHTLFLATELLERLQAATEAAL